MGKRTPRQIRPTSGVSRQEAEVYCFLRVLNDGSSSIPEIARRLGLSLAHSGAITRICESMAGRGEVELSDGKASLTKAGLENLATLAAKAGIKTQKAKKAKRKKPAGRSRAKSKRKSK